MDQYKTVMFPRQHVLKNLDQNCTRPVEELRTSLKDMKDPYLDLIEQNYDPEMEVDKLLKVYETFHHLIHDSTWGKVTWPC